MPRHRRKTVSFEQPNVPELSRQGAMDNLYRLALLGMDDGEIRAYFGVDELVWDHWCRQCPEIKVRLAEGRIEANGKVAAALFKRATGVVKKQVRVQHGLDADGQLVVIGKTVIKEEVPPDTAAALAWLKNKRSDSWKDKQEIEHNVTLSWADLVLKSQQTDLIDVTPAELLPPAQGAGVEQEIVLSLSPTLPIEAEIDD